MLQEIEQNSENEQYIEEEELANGEDEKLFLLPITIEQNTRITWAKQIKDLDRRLVASANELDQNYQKILSEDPLEIHEGLVHFRKYISIYEISGETLIQNILQFPNFIPIIIAIINTTIMPLLIYEATWILSSITSGNDDQTNLVVENEGIMVTIPLLSSPYLMIANQSAWAIGNISAENNNFRKVLQQNNVIKLLLILISKQTKLSSIKECVWACGNICKDYEFSNVGQKFQDLQNVIQIFSRIMLNYQDQDLLFDICATFQDIVQRLEFSHQLLIDQQIILKLIQLIGDEKRSKNQKQIIQILSDLLACDKDHCQDILDCGYLKQIEFLLLTRGRCKVLKEIIITLQNITAGSNSQMNSVIKNSEILKQIFKISKSQQWNVAKEALLILANVSNSATEDDIEYLISQNILNSLQELFLQANIEILELSLIILENIFRKGSTNQNGYSNKYTELFKNIGGTVTLTNLCNDKNDIISLTVQKIFEKYYIEDETLAK